MSDRGLIAAMVAQGIDRDTAEDMVARVTDAIVSQMMARKGVTLDGVGRLSTRVRRRRIVAPGPHRGKAIEERLASLSNPAVLTASEPYDV